MKTLTQFEIKSLLKPREADSHKGTYGHALIVAGACLRMGAAVISARACLRSGVGLLSVGIPKEERFILQSTIPEAMLLDRSVELDLSVFQAIGIGPAIGTNEKALAILNFMLKNATCPLLLDADALTLLSTHKELLDQLPKKTILTPHPKEFDRIFGEQKSHEDRMKTAIEQAKQLDLVIVLKGHQTLITYHGEAFLNSTGNSGLAKGGSGDALTGIITGLLVQGYEPISAAKIGVYLHGLAADLALQQQSEESMLITDVIECFGKAFLEVRPLRS